MSCWGYSPTHKTDPLKLICIYECTSLSTIWSPTSQHPWKFGISTLLLLLLYHFYHNSIFSALTVFAKFLQIFCKIVANRLFTWFFAKILWNFYNLQQFCKKFVKILRKTTWRIRNVSKMYNAKINTILYPKMQINTQTYIKMRNNFHSIFDNTIHKFASYTT